MKVDLERLMEVYRDKYPAEAERAERVARVIDPIAFYGPDGRLLQGEPEPRVRMARARARRKAHRVLAVLGVAQDLDWDMLMESVEGPA